MQAFQQRVVEEKSELDSKIEKLQPFLKSLSFSQLSNDEQFRLSTQLGVMTTYSQILERIANFKEN